jgi:transglutaminase-like putative cysteine protease
MSQPRRHFLLTATVLCLIAANLLAAEPQLDPMLDYRAERASPVTYDIELAAVVTAPYHTHSLKVWLPIPQSDFAQEVTPGEISTFPTNVKPQMATESVHGNKFAYFEFADPQGAQIIRHKFRVTTYELQWNIDSAQVTRPQVWPAGFDPYLRGDQAVVIDAAIQNQAREIAGDSENGADHLGRIMQWMQETMKYEHGNASLAANSLHAFQRKAGHCSDYHGLCSAFGRALGHPARVTYGLNTFPKSSPSHCKLEVFLPPYGWVTFDVSETQRLMQAIGKDEKLTDAQRQELQAAAFARLKSGFRDNTWLLQTRGTGYDLVPPAKKKVNVVRTIYAEADGVALPEPDPADPMQTEFAWQIGMQVQASKEVKYPFAYGK